METLPFDINSITELPFGLTGRIYRSPMPFGYFDPGETVFRSIRQAKINVVVVLTEEPEILQKTGRDLLRFYVSDGLEVIRCPIRDFSVPETASLKASVEAALALAQAGKNIAVHCNAGIGRTGLWMGCLARRALGLSGEQAIAWVRERIPGAMETEEQMQVVREYI